MREIFNPNSTFISQNKIKSFDEFLEDVSKFATYNKFDEIDIFTYDGYLFLVAFFGSILSGGKPYLLPYYHSNNSRPFIDDEAVSDILTKNIESKSSKIKLNLNSTFYIQTSGSSGERKNIEKSIDQMVKEGEFLRSFFNISNTHTFLSSVSHQHLFGLTFKVFTALISGSKVYTQNLTYPEILAQNIDLCSADDELILISSPVLLESLSKQKNMSQFNKIKMMFTAGSKLNLDILKSLQSKLSATITEIYGSSETGVIAYGNGESFKAFPSVNIKCDDENRLIICSPWLDLDNGFISNDCAEFNKDSFKIIGRYDRIIKLHDRRVSLDGIENLIKQSPLINTVAIAQDDRYKRLAAILVLSDEGKKLYKAKGKKAIVDEINSIVKNRYGNKLRYFYIRSSLPINNQDKIPKSDFLASINEQIKPKFNLISKESDLLKASAYIDEGCFYFNGHFLNFPLVPGFVQLGFVFDVIKEHLKIHSESITQVESIKFINFLRPCDMANLEIKITPNKLYFTLFANDKECANGRLKIAQ